MSFVGGQVYAKYMSKVFGEEIVFIPSVEEAKPYVEKLADGQIALLENIRYYKAEEAKEIVSEVNDKEIKVEQVNVPENVRNKSDKQYELPTLTKFCKEEEYLRVDVKNWLVKEGYITDMKNVTPKGKDIGIREIIADHNNKRLVYDEKAQNYIKSHIDDIEKLSGRSVKKHNTDEYLKKIKSVAKEAKTKDITNDITV